MLQVWPAASRGDLVPRSFASMEIVYQFSKMIDIVVQRHEPSADLVYIAQFAYKQNAGCNPAFCEC
jgi:hypothetical protein